MNRPLLPVAAVATTLVLWASAFVAIRHLGPDVPAGALSLGRLLVGSVALGIVLLVMRTPRRPTLRDVPGLVVIGVLWYAIYNVALNASETRIDAGTASILIQVAPILMTILAVFFLHEKPSRYVGPGLAIAFAGVAIIAFATSADAKHDWLGVVLALLAAAAYAVSMIVQKPLMVRLPAIWVTWSACTVGAVACLPFAGDLVEASRTAPASSMWWLVYLGIFPTAIAFTTWAFALSHMNASSLGNTTYLVPPLTVLMGWLFLGEVPPALAYVGGALCLAGVALTRRKPKPRPDPAAPQEARLNTA